MLVLTRRVGEEIVIAGQIRVRVIGVKGGKVQLGVTAPPHVPVDRSEVHDRRSYREEPTDYELVLVGGDSNDVEEAFVWPPIELGGGD
jgi:carbon storage regulator